MSKAVALFLCLFLPIAAAGAAEFFRSNELGMQLAPIGESERSAQQWVLEVQRSGQHEVRILTDKGEQYTRWEVDYRGGRVANERVYQKGELATTTEYRNGHPIRQTDYAGGKATTVREYSYSGNLLASVAVYDGAGTLRYRDVYSEGPAGRMRRAVREMPDGKKRVISLTFSGDRLVSEWLGAGGSGELLRYSDGSVVATENWTGTDLTSKESVASAPNGTVKVSTDYKTGVVTRRRYDKAGKILAEIVVKDGNTIRSVDYSYSKGKISSKLTKSPGQREEVRYQYDGSGELATSETTVNRQLVAVTHYTGKNSYFEDLYLNGQIVLHAYYEKGKLVREVPATSEGSPGQSSRSGG